jgi:hypothetical protein
MSISAESLHLSNESAAVTHLHGDPEAPTPGIGDGILLTHLDDRAIDAFLRVASDKSLALAELRHLGGALTAGRRRARPLRRGFPRLRGRRPRRSRAGCRAERLPGPVPLGHGALGEWHAVLELRRTQLLPGRLDHP